MQRTTDINPNIFTTNKAIASTKNNQSRLHIENIYHLWILVTVFLSFLHKNLLQFTSMYYSGCQERHSAWQKLSLNNHWRPSRQTSRVLSLTWSNWKKAVKLKTKQQHRAKDSMSTIHCSIFTDMQKSNNDIPETVIPLYLPHQSLAQHWYECHSVTRGKCCFRQCL